MTTATDRYTAERTVRSIDGYFFPSPTKPGGDLAEFKRAQAECASHLRAHADSVCAMTFEEFVTERQKMRGRPQHETAEPGAPT